MGFRHGIHPFECDLPPVQANEAVARRMVVRCRSLASDTLPLIEPGTETYERLQTALSALEDTLEEMGMTPREAALS